MVQKTKIRLGDLLVQNGLINDEQLNTALGEQRKTGRKLGATLIALEMVSEQQLLTLLSQHMNVPLINLHEFRVDPNVVKLLPEIQARRYRALVLQDKGDTLLVGMSDPGDINAVDELSGKLPKPIEVAVISETQLFEAYENCYRKTEEIASFAQELADEYSEGNEFSLDTGLVDEQDNVVAKLLQSIFEDAVLAKASDIHIEPEEKQLRIRMRVDGVLQENIIPEANIASALVLRLKLMSGLDISEKRLPQDGRTQVTIKHHVIDVRISTMPLQHGESVVMRLLDQSQGVLTLEQTGMPSDLLHRFRGLIKRPHGMILVTGPTGSGKTTTLYGALNELNLPENKIITVEDPVEYRLPRINQVQVNNKIDLTFASILRTTLRQDPDILMVGEMRDKETVEIGLRGALTGHLVLSTLHTNDAVSSAIRLIDMGAPGYLVASSLKCVIAQRLVRRVCANCSETAHPEDDHRIWLASIEKELSQHEFKKGRGCQRCNFTGYRGRVGVFELLEITEPLMNALKAGDNIAFAESVKSDPNFKSLAHAAFEYAKQGVTSLDEVMRLVEMVSDAKEDAPSKTTHDIKQDLTDSVAPIEEEQPRPDTTSGGLSLEDID
ncbi:MAG: ATPase, T2SS/T4P/T4SS family [Pseudomonadota bacterium]